MKNLTIQVRDYARTDVQRLVSKTSLIAIRNEAFVYIFGKVNEKIDVVNDPIHWKTFYE